MTTTTTVPLALHVPEAFTWVDRGGQRASDWLRYTVHAGLYRIRFTTGSWTVLPGNTRDEAMEAGMAKADSFNHTVDRTAFMPYYGVAKLTATLVESYYEDQFFAAVSGHHEEQNTLTKVVWQPYAYQVQVGFEAYTEWIGGGEEPRRIHRAVVVEMQPCDEREADAGERCEEGCSGGSSVAVNGGSAS